ncbi:MAG TPA: hypothetical protein VEK33_21650 [Terriglobales bacterium]|nr:hypothetical protein [Terriglobales bacterium]
MLKKSVCSIALVAALITLVQTAPAQNYTTGTPKPTIQDYGPFTSGTTTPTTAAAIKAASQVTKASTCGNPAGSCLFYGGDFVNNPLGPPFLPNGLANENDVFVPGTPYGAATWVPFTVPAGQTWAVTGLFTNNLSSYGVLDQSPIQPVAAAYWSINEDIEPGSAGTVVASGTSAATSTPTGRAAFDLIEYTVQVTGLSFDLTSGSYWMIVVPLCTNTADPYCSGVFFESDVEYLNVTPTNAFGPAEPVYAAFFDSPAFGFSFDPANGPLGACGGFGCDAFSAGVLGLKAR